LLRVSKRAAAAMSAARTPAAAVRRISDRPPAEPAGRPGASDRHRRRLRPRPAPRRAPRLGTPL